MPARMLTVGDLIGRSTTWLESRGVDSPRLDAELLLASVLGGDRLRLYLDWHKPLTELEVAAYRELIRRRGAERVPIARLLGHKEFYSREFTVTPAVFVPRPETEMLVDYALEALEKEPALQVPRPIVFEVGTGSGCIITSIAAERPGPRYLASEVSPEALAVAQRNAERHEVRGRIEWREGPIFAGYDGPVHLVVSNPPYIPSSQIPGLPEEVRVHDPHAALDGGEDGLDVLRAILAPLGDMLVPGGMVFAELGEDQREAALKLGEESGLFSEVRMDPDLSDQPRFFVGRRRAV